MSSSCDHDIAGSRDQHVTCTVRHEDLRINFAVQPVRAYVRITEQGPTFS
ncbi:MAG TPA: hypothetical protein VGN37_08355 [Actinocatenispora sp.]